LLPPDTHDLQAIVVVCFYVHLLSVHRTPRRIVFRIFPRSISTSFGTLSVIVCACCKFDKLAAGAMALTLHTTLGDIKVELYVRETPLLAENFLACAASGTYDGTLFHRNIKGFIVQGGDPTGTGKGGSAVLSTANAAGKLPDEFHPSLKHDKRGVVAMANNGPNTNACQFYITYSAAPSCDNVYSVIGKVINGMETIDAMEAAPVGPKYKPVTDIKIEKVTIHANPIAPMV
jgi:peptidyl-prolyl cis-trans isomerase-like 3